MTLESLPKYIICEICKYLDENQSIYNFNSTNKQISRKVTYYMVNNLIYNFRYNTIFVDMILNGYSKYEETHLKYIKKIIINDIKTLEFFRYNVQELYLDFANIYQNNDKICEQINKLKCPNLKKISFGEFNPPIKNYDFSYLEELSLADHLNQSIEHFDFSKLKKLSIGNHYDQPIDNIKCPNLEEISIGYGFTRSIENIKCPNLKKLLFAYTYDKTFDKLDCSKLEVLQISSHDTKLLKNVKFPNLKKLILPINCAVIHNIECPNLMELYISIEYNVQEMKCKLAEKYPNCKITML